MPQARCRRTALLRELGHSGPGSREQLPPHQRQEGPRLLASRRMHRRMRQRHERVQAGDIRKAADGLPRPRPLAQGQDTVFRKRGPQELRGDRGEGTSRARLRRLRLRWVPAPPVLDEGARKGLLRGHKAERPQMPCLRLRREAGLKAARIAPQVAEGAPEAVRNPRRVRRHRRGGARGMQPGEHTRARGSAKTRSPLFRASVQTSRRRASSAASCSTSNCATRRQRARTAHSAFSAW